ncbi:MAG: hypothetical protein C0605_08795 [Hyphomicrobiales bacterium]|nr:MAG: hypothetical protein C0605_08795 [Hyphomicrobiales bacterium]
MQVKQLKFRPQVATGRRVPARLCAMALLAGLLCAAAPAEAVSYSQYKRHRIVVKVDPGNAQKKSPAVSRQSLTARRKTRTNINNKVTAIFRFFQREKKLILKIKAIAATYKIDPLHILGAIAGEHAFNVDVYDKVQHYAMKSITFAGNRFVSFSCRKCRMSLDEFLKLDALKPCKRKLGSDRYWNCVENIWIRSYYNRTVDGRKFPRLRFNEAFFNPYALGQTYGLGQLSPLSALKATDLTHKIGGLAKLDSTDPAKVYAHIMDTEKNLHYIAATIRNAISIYRRTANFDISKNAGLVATLYNLGHVRRRAAKLYAANLKLLKAGKALQYPQVNYYGWFVNAHRTRLQRLLDAAT